MTFQLRTVRRRAALLAIPLLLASCEACTTYRTIRYRDPDARNNSMFPTRTIRKADAPFQFARAQQLRTDLDTLSVRPRVGDRIPFGRYIEQHDILAFLVIRNDTIVYETYRGGYEPARASITFSMSKSILSMLLGIALQEGAIKSLDQPVVELVPELRGHAAFDGVTLRHLFEMKSGLRHTGTEGNFLTKMRSDRARIYYTSDLMDFLRGAKRVAPPGSEWVYKDTDAELLGLALSRATGKSLSAYLEEKVWRRIGTEDDARWFLDHGDGQEKASNGLIATARDLAKVGRLYLNGGTWNGEQIVPVDWVARSIAVDTTALEPEISNWWQMQHRSYWWHPLQRPHGDFYADGARGQRLYVDPATRTIIVQLANESDQDFPFRKLSAYLAGRSFQYPRSIPALLRQAALAHGADSIRPLYERLDAERRTTPEAFVITESAMHTVGTLLLADSQHVRAAVEVLKLAAERSPGSARSWVALADGYEKTHQRDAALDALRRASALRPADSAITRQLRRLNP